MKIITCLVIVLICLLPQVSGACDTAVCGVGGNCQDPVSFPTTCTSCGTLTGLQSYLYPTNTSCMINCPSDSYKQTGNNTCTLCHASCNGCTGSNIICISCATNYYRKIGSSQCTNNCGVGYYGDSNTVHCTVCPSGCATCSMPISTVECGSCTTVGGTQYYLSLTSCVSNCPSGFYGDSTSKICTVCTPPCATCQGAALTCLTCSLGNLIYGTNACGACPGGQFDAGSNQCQLCDSNCATCSALTTCTSCGIKSGLQTYLHSNNKCYATCPSGFFGEYTTAYVCSGCDGSCVGCSISSINCILCAPSNYRKIGSSQCTTNCGTGYYGDGSTGLCTVCPVGCSACSYSAGVVCSACTTVAGVAYFLDSNSCHSSCPNTAGGAGQYGDTATNICSTCESTCQICSGGNANNCITCVTSRYLAYGLNTCDTSCPAGQYYPTGSQICYSCNVNCKNCVQTAIKCTSCGLSVNGATLFLYSSGNTCVSLCPGANYGNTTTNICDPCNNTCATCRGPTGTDCLTCTSGSLDSLTGECVSSCGNGYYSSNNVCYPCLSQCAKCTSAIECTQCQLVTGVPYFLNGTNCLLNCPSTKYGDTSTLTCVGCTSPCLTCSSSPTYCLSCVASNYLAYGLNSCDTGCPSNQYIIPSTLTCGLCNTQCLTCSSVNTCTSCGLTSTGLNLYLHTDAKCYQTCPSGFFGNTTTHDCVVCDGSCSGCTLSATNCLNCSGGNYRQIGSNACGSCAIGYYGDVATTLCTVCPTGCSKCTSATVCTECKAIAGHNHYLHGTQCLEVCPSTYFGETNGTGSLVCSSCVVPCATCSGSATSCLTCDGSNVLHYGTTTCSAGCPNGEFDGGSGRCLQCSIYCKTCSSLVVCTACNSLGGVGYYLNGSSCIATCPTTYYPDSVLLECKSCNPACSTCSGSSLTQCQSCQNNGTVDFYLIYGTSTCSQICPDSQYPSTNFQCLLCASSCLTCSSSASNCLTCGFSTILGADLFFYINQCLLTCPNGYYGKVADHTCTVCHPGCARCTDGTLTSCSVCANDTGTVYYKEIGATVCNTTCPDSQFISISVPFLCQACSSTCITCAIVADNCTTASCPVNLYYLNNSCLSQCPTGYYADASRLCQGCAVGCFSCFGAGSNKCNKCQTESGPTPYYLKDVSTCTTVCDNGFYGNATTNLCVACPAACKLCSSQTVCSSCQSVNGVGYYLNGSTCTIQCPLSQYGRVGDYTCQPCAAGCLACFGPALTQCYNCTTDTGSSTPYFLVYSSTICTDTCPDGQYKNTTSEKCLLCSASCLTCDTTATNCLTCGLSNAGVTLYKNSTTCLAVCPNGFWANSVGNTCDSCTQGCLTCTGAGLTNCLTCDNVTGTPYLKEIGATVCGTTCPDRQFISASYPNECQLCASNCITCSGTADNCTSSNCSINYYYLNNSCLTQCPNQYYPNFSLRQCQLCAPGCALCFSSGLSSCTQCMNSGGTDYFLQYEVENTCATTCNAGEFKDTTHLKCKACNSACQTCTSLTVCQSCQSVNGVAYFLSGTTCTISCPSTHYGQVSNSTCVLCWPGCKTCFGPTALDCYSCKFDGTDNYYLIYNTDICNLTCPDNQYQNTTAFACFLCSSGCLTCTGSSTYCTSCGVSPSGLILFLSNGTCIFDCSAGMYEDNTTHLCTACDSACLTCLDGSRNYCYSCGNLSTTQYYLIIGTTICSTSCPVGQYIDAAYPNNCQACSSNCVGCEGAASNCLSNVTGICPSNLFFNNATNSCVLVCPDGTYGDSISRFCESCASGCALCYGSVISKCTKCTSVLGTNYFKQINKDLCVQNCAAGEYGDASTLLCRPCSSACSICTNTATNCSQCQSLNGVAYYLSGATCTISCPSTHYGQISNLTCTVCSNRCATCYGSTEAQCYTCQSYGGTDYFLEYGTNYCRNGCPNGQYSNISNHQCMLCSGCLTCIGSAKNCLSCGFSAYGFHLYLYNNTCLLNCPNGFWANSVGNTCDSCTQGCLTCTGAGLTNCLTCDNVTGTPYLKEIGATVCGTTCPDRQFISASYPNECQLCASNCITCSGTADNCTNTNCSVNFYYLNNSCLSQCPSTHYYSDSSLRQCQLCATGCLRCFGPSSSECTQCDLVLTIQYYLQIGLTTCLPSCNPGQYRHASNKTCQLCNSACSTCSSQSVCLTCHSVNGVAYYLNGSNCIVSCPTSQYGLITNFTCQPCPNGCATCFGGTFSECYTCTVYSSTPYYLQYGTNYCATSCPSTQYKNDTSNKCLLCSSECLTCQTTASNCLSCGFSQYGFDLYLYGTKCLLTCPTGYWANITDHTCDTCTPGCSACTNAGLSHCSVCTNTTDIYYKDLDSTTCNLTCPDSQYISSSIPNLCQRCSSTCITCSVTAENCTNLNCSINYYFLNNSCLSQCPDQYYADSSARQCKLCTSGCALCTAAGLNSCSKCDAPGGVQYYKQIGLTTCSTGCNPGQYPSPLTKQCTLCPNVCATCSSQSMCLTCQSLHGVAYYLSGSSCIYSCPFGQYGNLNDFKCYTCPTGCLSCYGGSASMCHNCTNAGGNDYFLEYGTNFCSTGCTAGQYKNVSSYSCLLCDNNCKTCETTATTCLSCGFSSIGASLYLYQSGCLLTCPDGYFPNTTTYICDSCHQGCGICTGPSPQQCSKCRTANNSGTLTPYYKWLNATNCTTSCPTGQFVSGTVANSCSGCDPGCSSCAVLSTNCSVDSCNTGYFYHVVNSSCLTGCPNNYYANTSTLRCQQCNPGCALCYASGYTSCTKCQTTASNVSYYKVIDIDICNITCPDGQYPYHLLLTCQYCSSTCKTCNTSATDCQTCNNVSGVPYYQHSNQCLLSCPGGYYGQLSNNTCVGCFGGCKLCFAGNDYSCSQCQYYGGQVYYLIYGSTNCSLNCLDGQYKVAIDNACQLCDTNCYTCDIASTNCTSCFLTSTGIRLYLQNNLCVQSCATATYPNSTDNQCYNCNAGCQTCTGPSLNQCQACRDAVDPNNASNTVSYYLNIGNSICSLECPIGQYKRAGYPNVCQPCAVQCIGCSVSSTNCTISHMCTLGYYFYRATNSCISTCPSGYYANSTTQYCQPCLGGCALCKSGTLTNCQQCQLDPATFIAYYKQIYQESCVINCTAGEYEVLSDFSCQACHTSCVLCQGSSTTCQQCKNVSGVNYFYYNSECLLNCPNGMYGQKTNNTCVSCIPACKLCYGYSTEQCYSCQPDTTTNPTTYFYLSYSTTYCVQVCPYGQYAVNSTSTCQNCNINCATCEGTSTTCLTCTYVNTINIVYLHQNKCVVTCPGGYWPNSTVSLDHQCSLCHVYCTVCTGPTNVECTSCGNITTPNFTMYYKDRYSTTCNSFCPNGQYIDAIINNLCVPCDPKCLLCYNSSTNCTKCALGYYFYAPNNQCTALCPSGYFNDNTPTANNYQCSLCVDGCLTCNGPGLINCQTCQNVTVNGSIISYYKEASLAHCVTTCSTGYYGNVLNNQCDGCQTGCVSCQFSASYCYSCQSAGGSDYFKPKTSNSCVTVCPNGEYGNVTDYACHDCIYYTLAGSCVLTCPSGFFPQIYNSTKTICQNCSDPSVTGNPCNRSYTFTVKTKAIDNGQKMEHSVYLPNGLASNITAEQLMANLSVVISQPSRRLLQRQEKRGRMLTRGRLLAVTTPLAVYGLTISADRKVIYIITDYSTADFSVATVVVDFPGTTLISADGLLYQSTTGSFSLSDPSFQQSLYQIFGKDLTLGAEGIIFIILSILLLIFQLVIANRKGYHEMMAFIMFLQVMGISRIRQYPIDYNVYSVLLGFSYYQLPFIPNGFAYIFPADYLQNSAQAVAFAYTNHNLILNLGPIIEVYIFLQLVLGAYYICKNDRPQHLARMKLYQQTLVVFFMVITLYMCCLAMESLTMNQITDLVAQYLASIGLALLLLIFYLVYVGVWIRPYRLFQLYKINNICRVVGLAILPTNRYVGLIIIDIFELVFFIIDMVLYRSEKLNIKAYVLERMLILVAINASIFSTNWLSLIISAGISIALIFFIKIYYTVITVKAYLDESKLHGASQLDVSDVVNLSVKDKDEPMSVHYDMDTYKSKINQSNNFIYNQSMEIDKFDQMPSKNELLKYPQPSSLPRYDSDEEEEEKKEEDDHREKESEESNEQMIVYLDPDDYKEDTRRKQDKIKEVNMPRPESQQRGGPRRRNIRTEGMKTAANFYPRDRSITPMEGIEVIKVEPGKEEASQNSDIVSDSSDGIGWLAQNDTRNLARAKRNKLVWKIMEEDPFTKKQEE